MYVHSITYGSKVNGPGVRNVLHVQGCSIGCPGCFSPHTWKFNRGVELDYEVVVEALLSKPCDGVTISGGEPTDQESDLINLIEEYKVRTDFEKSIVVFSGYTRYSLEQRVLLWDYFDTFVDVLVCGPYVRELSVNNPRDLRGSSNQEVVLFSGCYRDEDLIDNIPVEVIVDDEGATITGFPNTTLIKSIREDLEGTCLP